MIYLIPILLSLIGYSFYNRKNIEKSKYLYWLTCLSIILIFGLRFRVGGDTLNYMIKYDLIPEFSQLGFYDFFLFNVEPGFVILCSLSKQLFNSFYPVQLIESALINISVFSFAKKYIGVNFLFTAIYFVTLSFYFNTEIMREGCAISFFLIALLKYNKNIFKFYLWMIPAVLFHYSSLFLLFYPLLINKIKIPIRAISYGVLVIILLSVVDLPVVSGYLGSKIEQSAQYQFTFWGKLSSLIKFVVFPCILYKYLRNKIDNEYRTDFCSFMSLYIFYGMLTLGPYSMFMRLMNYLNPFFLVFITYFFTKSFKYNSFYFFKKMIFVVYLYFFYIAPYLADQSHIVPGTHFYTCWFPYYSIFNEKQDLNRETFVRVHFDYLRERRN